MARPFIEIKYDFLFVSLYYSGKSVRNSVLLGCDNNFKTTKKENNSLLELPPKFLIKTKKICYVLISPQSFLWIAVLYLYRSRPLHQGLNSCCVFVQKQTSRGLLMKKFSTKHAKILLENIHVKGNLSSNKLLELSFAKPYPARKQPLKVFRKKDVQ